MNMDESVDKTPLQKCSTCYWASICMLTTFMRSNCGGPFKGQDAHLAFIENNIKGK